MNWLVKVAAFKLLSAVPGGKALYRFSQERITHSLVPAPARVDQKIQVGLRYWNWLAANSCTEKLIQGVHLDLGAGWHPTIPLLYYCLGVSRQQLFDTSPLLNRELVSETVKTVLQIVTDPRWAHRSLLRRLPEINAMDKISWAEYLRQMGITYHAPYASMYEGMVGTVEAVTCTQVLYYIGRDGLRHCFRQCHQSLKPGGKFLATIHLNDTHAAPGNGLSQYNNLKFSPAVWEGLINSSLMSNNRLKAPDYRELLEEAGFQIVHFEVEGPTASDLRELDQIPVHSFFNRYTREELGAKHLFFVAEKR